MFNKLVVSFIYDAKVHIISKCANILT